MQFWCNEQIRYSSNFRFSPSDVQTARICETLESSVCTANNRFLIQFINVLATGKKQLKDTVCQWSSKLLTPIIFLVRSYTHESLLVNLYW